MAMDFITHRIRGKIMDLTGQIIAYESGELSDEETIELFSMLVKNGMAWTLQGSYGRMAQGLIDAGFLSEIGEIDYERINDEVLEGNFE